MANNKAYKCSNCGHVEKKWFGKCPNCGQWETAEEITQAPSSGIGATAAKPGIRAARVASGRAPQPISKVREQKYERLKTGIGELDRVLGGGFVPGGVILLAGPPGTGKALALDTLLPTPFGWTTMGNVAPGDQLIGRDGNPTTVVAATDVMYDRPCYIVEFSDGSQIIADEQHQWITSSRIERAAKRRPNQPTEKVRTTKEIYETLFIETQSEKRLNHSVELSSPIFGKEQVLVIPPYTLGAWLGDGTSTNGMITSHDPEILSNIEDDGFIVSESLSKEKYFLIQPRPVKRDKTVINCVVCETPLGNLNLKGNNERKTNYCYKHRNYGTFHNKLREVGVLADKHIPASYLRSSLAQRRELLAGLLDTDGYASKQGSVVLALTSKKLVEDAYELISSLGYKAAMTQKKVKGRTQSSSIAYSIQFTTSMSPFKLFRKSERVKPQIRATQTRRYITAVKPVSSVPVRCVQVDNEDHTYLVGKTFIPTHNSSIVNIAAKALADQNQKVLIISGEETESQIASRAVRMNAVSDNIYLLSESNLDNALEHANQLNPDFFVIDSMQTMVSATSEGRVGSPSQVIEVATEVTNFAKRNNTPTIIIGHVTKEGTVGGPRAAEHLVDTVLYFESQDESPLRLLRATKNRFGDTTEIGVFEHTEDGLEEVDDPSGFFLDGHADDVVGYATSILVEGNRALPIEIQALVTSTALPNPRKISNGLDHGRVMMIQAILEKHGALRLSDKDLYVSTTGGLLTKDSSIDLAIAAAIISSYKSVALPEESVFLGETSLTGEIRSPRGARKRAGEARRLGFNKVVMALGKDETPGRYTVSNIRELLALIGSRGSLPPIGSIDDMDAYLDAQA